MAVREGMAPTQRQTRVLTRQPTDPLPLGGGDPVVDATTAAKRSFPARWDAGLIFVAAAFGPTMTVLDAAESPRLLTYALVVTVVASFAFALWWILTRFGLDGRGSAYGVAGFMLVVTNVGGWLRYGEVSRAALVAGALVVAALVYRLARHRSMQGLATCTTLFLLVYPLTVLGGKVMSSDPVMVDTSTESDIAGLSSKPDILMLVLDAYGGPQVLEDIYGYDNGAILDRLRDRGFDVPAAVTANYGRTQLSVSTVLQMDYVAGEQVLTQDDIHSLLRVMGGDNRLASTLRAQGYRTVHVESGWLGSRCGPRVDVCVESPWPDETFYDAVYRSILVGLPGLELGRPFTLGALNAMTWLEKDLPRLLADDQPDFIFAHVLMPHPPLFLDGDCTPDWRGGAQGFAMGRAAHTEADTARVRSLYLQQVECANSLITRVTGALGEDDAIVIMGDHGPDSQGQLYVQSDAWTDEQRVERFGAFLAARVPGCEMADVTTLVNVSRRMMSCLTGEEMPDRPTRVHDLHKTPGETRVIELPSTGTALVARRAGD